MLSMLLPASFHEFSILFLTFFYDPATFYTMYDSCTNLGLENMVTGC